MAYRVHLVARAELDLSRVFEAVNAANSEGALKWYHGLQEAMQSLEKQPARCPAPPGNDRPRHVLYGHKPHIYRVIYCVLEKQQQVVVLHIRHGARRSFEWSEVS